MGSQNCSSEINHSETDSLKVFHDFFGYTKTQHRFLFIFIFLWLWCIMNWMKITLFTFILLHTNIVVDVIFMRRSCWFMSLFWVLIIFNDKTYICWNTAYSACSTKSNSNQIHFDILHDSSELLKDFSFLSISTKMTENIRLFPLQLNPYACSFPRIVRYPCILSTKRVNKCFEW